MPISPNFKRCGAIFLINFLHQVYRSGTLVPSCGISAPIQRGHKPSHAYSDKPVPTLPQDGSHLQCHFDRFTARKCHATATFANSPGARGVNFAITDEKKVNP